MEKQVIEHPTTKTKATFYTNCPTCERNKAAFLETGRVPFAPDHEPGFSCRSGQKPHCTCDSCF